MRALDFTQVQLNEAIPILNISSWFDQKAKNKRVGAAQIKKFTNEHENAFMNFMGLQRVDWPTVTMYVIYRYLTLKMKLKNNDVVSVVNEVLRDLMADAKIKTLSLEQIQDVNKELKVTNLTNGARNAGQKIAEMIIASGALRQLERHWEDEEKVDDEEKIGQAKTQTEPAATFGLSKEAVENAISLIQQGDEQAALTILRQSIGASTAQNNTKSKVTLQQAQSTSKKQAQSVPHPTQPDKATPTSNADTIPIKIPT
jgi:Cu/Ag efflux protein CusF